MGPAARSRPLSRLAWRRGLLRWPPRAQRRPTCTGPSSTPSRSAPATALSTTSGGTEMPDLDLAEATVAALAEIRARRPLIHQITNYVVMNDTANVTLHIGASPVM